MSRTFRRSFGAATRRAPELPRTVDGTAVIGWAGAVDLRWWDPAPLLRPAVPRTDSIAMPVSPTHV